MLLSGGGQVGNFLTQGGKVFPPWVGKFSHLSPPLRSFRDLAISWGTSALTVVPQLIKRLLHFFDRASPKAGIEPTILRLTADTLTHWAILDWLKMEVYLKHYIIRCLYILGFLTASNIFKVLNWNYWKIAGLRPAIFSGTPRNIEA